MAAAEPAQGGAITAGHRQRAGDAATGEMGHQAEEPRQLGGFDALLIEREDEVAGGGAHREIAVLDAFGDAAEGERGADVVVGEERRQCVVETSV